MLPISPSPTRSYGLDEGTPPPEAQRANPQRDEFLSRMGRDDLVTVAQFLDEQIGVAQWAFTGSTALSIHAQVADRDFGRVPGDVDVLVDTHRLNCFVLDKIQPEWQQAGLDFHRDAEGHAKHHILTLQRAGAEPLSIDLIASGNDKAFGTLDHVDFELRQMCGVSVLTTDTLASSLKKRLEFGEAGAHTEHDLQFIGSLQQREPGASLNALAVSPEGRLSGHVRRRDSSDADAPGPSNPKRARSAQD